MIYHIYANRSNIGDWLSAKGIRKLLSPLEITECLCDVPFIDETMHRLSDATEKDLIVIGGGGLLMDYFTPFWKAFEPVAHRVPFCIWGIGYCDLKNEASLAPNELIENIINQSKLCIVRDELSRSYLSQCNLPEPVQCPSINVIDRLPNFGKDILHVDNYTTAGEEAYNAMCLAAEHFAINKGITYRQTNNQILKNSENGLAQILSLYARSGYVLSSALHGCIIGVAMGLKVLAVSGDRKIEGFMDAVGLNDWVLDVQKVNLVSNRLSELNLQSDHYFFIENIRKKNIEISLRIKQIAADL
jgi:polysaccharide pyruvyl transferase WcaK-like protein